MNSRNITSFMFYQKGGCKLKVYVRYQKLQNYYIWAAQGYERLGV